MFFFFIFYVAIASYCLIFIAKLNLQPASQQTIIARKYGISAYSKLRNIILSREERSYGTMNDSARKFYDRTVKQKKRAESHPGRVQRLQRDTPRFEVQILVNTAGLNLDSFILIFKTGLFSFFLFFYLNYSNFNYIFSTKTTRLVCLFFCFWAVHTLVHRLALRRIRFWFWRQWPAVFQLYAKGFYPYKTGFVTFVLYFIPILWWSVFFLFFWFLLVTIDQTYFRKHAYFVWGGILRINFWKVFSSLYVEYSKYLKPWVTFFFKIIKPHAVRFWRKLPRPRLPQGYTFF